MRAATQAIRKLCQHYNAANSKRVNGEHILLRAESTIARLIRRSTRFFVGCVSKRLAFLQQKIRRLLNIEPATVIPYAALAA